jgi:hypothetical protein
VAHLTVTFDLRNIYNDAVLSRGIFFIFFSYLQLFIHSQSGFLRRPRLLALLLHHRGGLAVGLGPLLVLLKEPLLFGLEQTSFNSVLSATVLKLGTDADANRKRAYKLIEVLE